jgi:hypothetical protein
MGAGHWRPGGLLCSPFNVKWRFSAPAGDVEESKLCLFSVIMPAKCVSSVSPRFHYRRVAFCFLPLAAILEFLSLILLIWVFFLLRFVMLAKSLSILLIFSKNQLLISLILYYVLNFKNLKILNTLRFYLKK